MTARATITDVHARLERILEHLGEEGPDGKGGTGMIGRLARIEDRVNQHDRLVATVRGMTVGVAAMAVALWWMLKNKIESALGISA